LASEIIRVVAGIGQQSLKQQVLRIQRKMYRESWGFHAEEILGKQIGQVNLSGITQPTAEAYQEVLRYPEN